MKEKKKKSRKIKIKKKRILFLIAFFTITYVIRSFNLVIVNGESMEPTYFDKNILTSEKIEDHSEKLKVNDVVVFTLKDKPDFLFIKRIVGLPGDSLEIKDGYIYRNNKKTENKFEKIKDPGLLKDRITLKDDEYFCMGDNRNDSYDSRKFGPVKKDRITHKIKNKLLGLKFN